MDPSQVDPLQPAPGSRGVSLQISLTPLDLQHAALILPHQLRVWAPCCQELMLVWDADPGPRWAEPAYRARWQRAEACVPAMLAALRQQWPRLKSVVAPADEPVRLALAQRFLAPGSGPMPAKDFRGGPFSSYFYGLAACAHDLVLHLDADMIFGGQSPDWIREAKDALGSYPRRLCVAPPGGPGPHAAQLTPCFTTRCFLLDRRRLTDLSLSHRRLTDLGEGPWVSPYAELPENLISTWMQAHGLQRLDLPGHAPGMWSLHPPVPPVQAFWTRLQTLLRAVDANALPAAQQGHYNLLPEVLAQLQDAAPASSGTMGAHDNGSAAVQ